MFYKLKCSASSKYIFFSGSVGHAGREPPPSLTALERTPMRAERAEAQCIPPRRQNGTRNFIHSNDLLIVPPAVSPRAASRSRPPRTRLRRRWDVATQRSRAEEAPRRPAHRIRAHTARTILQFFKEHRIFCLLYNFETYKL